jgi:hypothetical protein
MNVHCVIKEKEKVADADQESLHQLSLLTNERQVLLLVKE